LHNIEKEAAHRLRLFLLHPMAGAVYQMPARLCVGWLVCIFSKAPGAATLQSLLPAPSEGTPMVRPGCGPNAEHLAQTAGVPEAETGAQDTRCWQLCRPKALVRFPRPDVRKTIEARKAIYLMDDLQRDVAAIARIDVIPTILEVVCRTTGMGFAAVARVTEDRWVACAVRDEIQFGLAPGGELKVETTICDAIRASGQPVVIDHVASDQDFCGHPTPAMYGFQSYISMPILRKNGAFFGTLCAIDRRPAKVKTPQTIDMFRLFSDLIGFHLEAQERLVSSEAALLDERQTADVREQFIAVLGHDLRNPLASIDAGTRLLGKSKLDDKAQGIVALIEQSVRRMAGLIDDVLDLARGRLGGGLTLDRNADEPLAPALEQVVAELRSGHPGRQIDVHFQLVEPIVCDRPRIAQLLSNLLANALTHGTAAPVTVRAAVRDATLELSVANKGDPIPPAVAERLFEPFYRSSIGSDKQGLGLGLYIASEIASAHGGTLKVNSTPEETRFVLRIPVA
jgi:signal transduction histidine kinase